MKIKAKNLIAVVLAVLLVWQGVAWARPDVYCLRPCAYRERDFFAQVYTVDDYAKMRLMSKEDPVSMAALCFKRIKDDLSQVPQLLQELELPDSFPLDERGRAIPDEVRPRELIADCEEAISAIDLFLQACEYPMELRRRLTYFNKTLNVNCLNCYARLQLLATYLNYAKITGSMDRDRLMRLQKIYEIASQGSFLLFFVIDDLGSGQANMEDVNMTEFVRSRDNLVSRAIDWLKTDEELQVPENLKINEALGAGTVRISGTSPYFLEKVVQEPLKNAVMNFVGAAAADVHQVDPVINVSLQIKGGHAVFTCENNMVGIDAARLSAILLPGYSSKREYQALQLYKRSDELAIFGGLGLGLAKLSVTCRCLKAALEIYVKTGGKAYKLSLDEDHLPLVEEADPSVIGFESGFKVIVSILGAYEAGAKIPRREEVMRYV